VADRSTQRRSEVKPREDPAVNDYATLDVRTARVNQPEYDVLQLDPRHRRLETNVSGNDYLEPEDFAVYVNYNVNRQR